MKIMRGISVISAGRQWLLWTQWLRCWSELRPNQT